MSKEEAVIVDGALMLSDTTKDLLRVAKILDAVVKDKDEDRTVKYHARQALNSIRMVISAKVEAVSDGE